MKYQLQNTTHKVMNMKMEDHIGYLKVPETR